MAPLKNFVSNLLQLCILTTSVSAVSLHGSTITLSQFTTPNSVPALNNLGAIGFTFAGNEFVGSVYQGGQLYSTDLSGGSVALFGPSGVLNNGRFEHYVASSYGLGGFPNGDIYVGDVTSGGTNEIQHIANNGSGGYTVFATLPSGSGAVRGILFDTGGTFGNNMLVSTNLGNIYKVSSSGVVKPLANVGEDTEAMTVVPTSGVFNAGSLIVASETSGKLRAITPSGIVTQLNTTAIPNAEIVDFVPLNLLSSGSPLAGYYESNYSQVSGTAVWFAGASQFSSMLGDLIVTQELRSSTNPNPQILDLHWDGTMFVQTVIDKNFGPQPEDGIFVTPAILATVTPEPSALLLATAGLSVLGLLVRSGQLRRVYNT